MEHFIDDLLPRMVEVDVRAMLDGGRYMPQDIARVMEPVRSLARDKLGDNPAVLDAAQQMLDSVEQAAIADLNRAGHLSAPIPQPWPRTPADE